MSKSENETGGKKPSWQVVFVLIIIALAIGLKLYSYYWPKAEIKVNGEVLKVLVAKDYKHLVKGLSGRKDLGGYDGMLFVFGNSSQHTMVMRDMEFPIDIIWIDKGQIVDIAPSAPVEPGKIEGEYFPYLARSASSHVLEVPAGTAVRQGWKIGDKVDFHP